MMLIVRHGGRFVADVVSFTARSGRWWITLLVIVLLAALALGGTASVAVPVVTYTLF